MKFNKIYHLQSSAYYVAPTVAVSSSEIYVSGYLGYENDDFEYFISKISSEGEQAWEYAYRIGGDTMNVMSEMIVTQENKLVQIGSTKSNNVYPVFLHIMSADGDSLQTVFYDSLSRVVIFDLCEDTAFGGFYAVGRHINAQNNYDVVLMRVGSQGEYLWHKYIGGSGHEVAGTVVMHPEGGVVVGGYLWDGNVDSDTWFFRADTSGNVVWSKNLNFGSYSDSWAHVLISSDGYLYVGAKHTYDYNFSGYYPSKAFLGKYTLSGQEVWTREYGRLWGVNEDSDAYFGIRELKNGNIVGITNGFYKIPENTTGGLITCAMQITPDGDSVWSKYYGYPPLGAYTHYSWALDATEDGGFVTAGFVQPNDTGSQDMWVVKFDSNGCYDTLTDCVVGVEEQSAFGNQLLVWPNPVVDVLHLNVTDRILSLEAVDVWGRVVPLKADGDLVDVRKLSDGMYIIRVRSARGIETSKFIK